MITAQAPDAEILLGDRLAGPAVPDQELGFREVVEPGEDGFAQIAAFEAMVEFFADEERKRGNFAPTDGVAGRFVVGIDVIDRIDGIGESKVHGGWAVGRWAKGGRVMCPYILLAPKTAFHVKKYLFSVFLTWIRVLGACIGGAIETVSRQDLSAKGARVTDAMRKRRVGRC